MNVHISCFIYIYIYIYIWRERKSMRDTENEIDR